MIGSLHIIIVFFVQVLINSLLNASDKFSFVTKIEKIFERLLAKLDMNSKDYDRKLFFSNTIKEELERNYINVISNPLKFHAALIAVNTIFKK